MDYFQQASPGPRWGDDVPPAAPAPMPTPAPHRPWSGVLLGCHVVVTVIAGICAGVGAVVAAVDLADRGEEWDGLLAVIFGILAVAGLAVGAAALTLALLTRRGRRRADDGDPGLLHGIAITALVLSGLAVLLHLTSLFRVVADGSPGAAVLQLVTLVPVAVYGLAAVMTLRTTRG